MEGCKKQTADIGAWRERKRVRDKCENFLEFFLS